MTDSDDLFEKKNRLEKELENKIANDYCKFIEQSNEYLQKTKENIREYYQGLLSKELDSMENAINSGNTLQATSHKLTANVYESIIKNL